MSISKILKDLCPIKINLKIEITFADIVLVVKGL